MRFIGVILVFAYGSVLASKSFVWAACLFLWNNIFQPMGFSYSQGTLPMAQYVFVILVASYLFQFSKGVLRPRLNLMVVLCTFFLIWLFLSSILSPFQDSVWEAYLGIAKYLLPLILISSGLSSYKDIILVSATLTVSVGVWSSYTGVRCLVSGATSNMSIKYGQMTDNNDFTAAIVGVIPALFFFSTMYEGRSKNFIRATLLLVVILSIVSIFFSFSRGAVLGLIGMVTFYVIFCSSKKIRNCIILITVLVAGTVLLPDAVTERLRTIDLSLQQQTEASASSRLHLMKSAFNCAVEHPVFGIGPDLWILVAEDYSGMNSEPHSAYIKMAAEIGFVGAGIFLLLFFLTLKRLFKQRRWAISRGNYAIANLSLTLAMVLVGIGIPFIFLNQPYSEFLWAWLGVASAFLALDFDDVNCKLS